MAVLKAFVAVCAILLVGSFLAFFLVFKSPQDLRLTSVEIIRSKDIPLKDDPTGSAEPTDLLAAVHFTTETDLVRFSPSWLYGGLYVHSSLCQSGTRFSRGTNLVYNSSGKIGFDRSGTSSPDAHHYHVYFNLKPWDEPRIDLVTHHEDVCLVVVPDALEFGYGPSTNILRIPAERLANALTGPHSE